MKRILPLLLIVVILVVVAVYLSGSDRFIKSTAVEQTDFAIDDTSAVGKIIIADRSGRVAQLKRKPGGWTVNDKYPAREDAIGVLLNTFLNVYIQRPVPKDAQEQVNTVMAAGSKKVEVYDNDGEWIKTWYVGHATMDKKGTYMLLETPEYGLSSAPFIMDMKGFIGMLNTRFFTDENEWRSTLILSYPEMRLSSIQVEYPNEPESSFVIEYAGGNDIFLYTYDGNKFDDFDSSAVKDYMLNYKLMGFENYRTGLTDLQVDSVRKTVPYQIITVQDGTGRHEFKLWPKKAREGAYSEEELAGEALDPERVYASYNGGELALAQRFQWDRFRAPLKAFIE